MPEQEEVGWCKIMGARLVREDPQTIFSTEIPTFLRGVDLRIILMKAKLSLFPCRGVAR
jgi:hypothetical protein